MDQPPLFNLDEPACEMEVCKKCARIVFASTDRLRVAGWLVFDGSSQTNEPLHVRICKECR